MKPMMLDSTPTQYDPVWLRSKDYRVVTLNPRIAASILGLERLPGKVLATCPDIRRKDFYNIEMENGWSYVHIHHGTRTVYLIGHCVVLKDTLCER